jgi:hypothetical protein
MNPARGVFPKYCVERDVCEALPPRPLFAFVMLGFETRQHPDLVFVSHFMDLPSNLTSRINEYR